MAEAPNSQQRVNLLDVKVRQHLTKLFKAQSAVEQTDCSIGYLSDMLLKVSLSLPSSFLG